MDRLCSNKYQRIAWRLEGGGESVLRSDKMDVSKRKWKQDSESSTKQNRWDTKYTHSPFFHSLNLTDVFRRAKRERITLRPSAGSRGTGQCDSEWFQTKNHPTLLYACLPRIFFHRGIEALLWTVNHFFVFKNSWSCSSFWLERKCRDVFTLYFESVKKNLSSTDEYEISWVYFRVHYGLITLYHVYKGGIHDSLVTKKSTSHKEKTPRGKRTIIQWNSNL